MLKLTFGMITLVIGCFKIFQKNDSIEMLIIEFKTD